MSQSANSKHIELIRGLGLVEASAIVTGSVIGTGIFLVPSTIARETGSVGGVFLVWLIGGLLSLAGALSYAELGAAMPEAGGEYAFLRRAYGPFWGFLFGWQQLLIGKTGTIAGVATAFAIFIGFFLDGVLDRALHIPFGPFIFTLSGLQAIAILAIICLTALNYLHIAVSGAVQSLLTAAKIAAILALAGLALSMGAGHWENLQLMAGLSEAHGFLGYIAALSAALWAYDGWNNLTLVGGEVRDPHRTIPSVLILGMLGVMAVYMFTNLAYFYLLPLDAVSHSQRVAQDAALATMGALGAAAITLVAAVSTLSTLNASILTGARVIYAMARDGLFFRKLAGLNHTHHTPAKALLLQCLAAICLVLVLGRDNQAFERMFNFAMFGTWMFYGITGLAVIVLRHRHPTLPSPYRTLGYPWIPLAFVGVSATFCIGLLISRPQDTGLGLALLAAGIPFYFYWKYRQGRLQ